MLFCIISSFFFILKYNLNAYFWLLFKDKRFALDNVEKSQLQKCLDTLQHSIKVISLQSMMERLESLSRQLGYAKKTYFFIKKLKQLMFAKKVIHFVMIFRLKFTPSHHGTEVFISSDMFFVEVQLESTGAVKDVKINHEGKNEHQVMIFKKLNLLTKMFHKMYKFYIYYFFAEL